MENIIGEKAVTTAAVSVDGSTVVAEIRPTFSGTITALGPKREPCATQTQSAKELIIEGLRRRLRHFGTTLPQEEARNAETQLAKGASLRGFAATKEGVKVKNIDGLRSLLFALWRPQNVFDIGYSRLLFRFGVPPRFAAFAGEAGSDSARGHYAAQDREARRGFEKRTAAGLPGEKYEEFADPFNEKRLIGRWEYLFCKGIGTTWESTPVRLPNGRFIEQVIQRTVSTTMPLPRVHTLDFLMEGDQLLAWQPGKYTGDWTAEQWATHILLFSGECAPVS